jgi:hypothetical protein
MVRPLPKRLFPGAFFNQKDDRGKKKPGQELQGLIVADLSGERGTQAVIGLDEPFAEGMGSQTAVPEVLQQDHFLGQGGAVGRGGDKAKLLYPLFLCSFLFFRFCRVRHCELDGGYFGDTGEFFIRRQRFCRIYDRLSCSRLRILLRRRRGLSLRLVFGVIEDAQIMLIISLA